MPDELGVDAISSLSEFPRQRTPLRQEIAEIVRAARVLVGAYDRRNPTSDYATLGEEEALMFLKERIAAVEKRLARRG